MRIYIENIEPRKISYQNLASLEKIPSITFKRRDVLEIFSEKGLYMIENAKVWKLVPTNEKVRHHVEDGAPDFLIDETEVERKVCSQIPMHHVPIKTTIFSYETRNARLVIEGSYDDNNIVTGCAQTIDKSDKYSNFKVKNFYFEPKNEKIDISNNSFLKNDINVFLSLLNNIRIV